MSLDDNLPKIEVAFEYQLYFFDTPVKIVKARDGHLYASLLSLCSIFELDEVTELARLKKQAVFKTTLVSASANKKQNYSCLRLGYMAIWLLNLPLENLSNPITQQALFIFQHNAAWTLEEAYLAGRLTTAHIIGDSMIQDSDVGKAYREALAVLGLAKDQLIWECESRISLQQIIPFPGSLC